MSFFDFNLLTRLFCLSFGCRKAERMDRRTRKLVFAHNSWSFFHATSSPNASNATKAIDASGCLPLLGSVHGDGVCPTDFPRAAPRRRDPPAALCHGTSITRASASRWHAPRWPKPTRAATGRIWADLPAKCSSPAGGNFHTDEGWGIGLKANGYAFDTTTIDLCLKLFPPRSSAGN